MKLTVDTDVLVRAVVRDHAVQARTAAKALTGAELIAVTLPCLCEFVWVLRKVYGLAGADIVVAIRALLAAGNVEADRQGAEAGLKMLEAGGDFCRRRDRARRPLAGRRDLPVVRSQGRGASQGTRSLRAVALSTGSQRSFLPVSWSGCSPSRTAATAWRDLTTRARVFASR